MPPFFKHIFKKVYFTILFIISITSLTLTYYFTNVFALEENPIDRTLLFPYAINFSPKEIKLLNSLPESTFQKILNIANTTYQKNISTQNSITQTSLNSGQNNPQSTNNPQATNPQTSQPSATQQPQQQNPLLNALFGQQPTQVSPVQTPQTPFFNPSTGQFQNTPPQGGIVGAVNNVVGGGGVPQVGANVPPLLGGSVDLDKLNVLPICKQNYGVNLGGSCPDIESASVLLKETTALACSAIGKKINSISVVRSKACAKGKGAGTASQHVLGTAIDVSQGGLTSAEKQKVFEVFRKKGFKGVGCYGLQGHVHFDHGPARRWYNGACPPELKLAGY